MSLLYNVLLLSELYENLEKVGSSVKHHIVEGMRNMWNQLNELARAHSSVATPKEEEQEIAQCEHNDYVQIIRPQCLLHMRGMSTNIHV